MSASKIILSLLLLAAVAGGGWLLFPGDDAAPPTPPPPPPVVHDQRAAPPPPPQAGSAANPGRTLADDTDLRAESDADQGIAGRVLRPDGLPAAAVPVYLMPNLSSDPIQVMLQNRGGGRMPPLAQGRTKADGSFRLGLGRASTACDLCIVPDAFPQLDRRLLKPQGGDWIDLGELRLEAGATVMGRVSEEGTGAAIASATVYLTAGQNFLVLAPPDRERGVAIAVDSNGNYRTDCAPRQGAITLAAEAPDHARIERQNLAIQPDQANVFDLELPRGRPIAGVVQDKDGRPIAGASIVATAISSKLPQTGRSSTGRDGSFQIEALREGPYELVASAVNYADKPEKPVLAGDLEVHLVLEQLGTVKVRVLDKRQRPLKAFTVALKRSFPNSPIGIGNVAEFHNVSILPGDFDGDFASVRAVPNGDFVLQIAADKYARTLSEPFHVAAGSPPAEVTVQMSAGGVLRGRVVDDRGNPVPGAAVATAMNGAGLWEDTELGGIFGKMLPDKITKTSARTDAQGNYRLPLLALGDYMLRAQHPAFCEGTAAELSIRGEDEVLVPDIVLFGGAVVQGLVTVDGKPGSQVRINIGPPQDTPAEQQQQGGKQRQMFVATATSDANGNYRFLKRVPPGTYEIHALRSSSSGNPFDGFLDMRATARRLLVPVGQDQLTENFALQGR